MSNEPEQFTEEVFIFCGREEDENDPECAIFSIGSSREDAFSRAELEGDGWVCLDLSLAEEEGCVFAPHLEMLNLSLRETQRRCSDAGRREGFRDGLEAASKIIDSVFARRGGVATSEEIIEEMRLMIEEARRGYSR